MDPYVKRFDDWNESAKKLNGIAFSEFFHEREIWWCALGVNIGSEQDGKNDSFERPVLIVKKISQDLLLMVPLTSKIGNYTDRISARIAGQDSQILVSQERVISSKRLLRRIGRVKATTFQTVILKLIELLLPVKSETPHKAGNLGGP